MNKLLSLSLLTLLALLTACQQDPQSSNTPAGMRPLTPGGSGGGSSTPAANPVIVSASGFDSVNSKKVHASYQAIFVMNADGSNLTRVITASSVSDFLQAPKWSNDGSHIVYVQAAYGVRRADISVVNGVPHASNITTIAAYAPSDSITYNSAVWSPDGSTIALSGYVRHTGKATQTRLWTVSSSGGSRTVLYTRDSSETVMGLTWSPDGSYLACVAGNNSSHVLYVKILDASTGAITDSLFGGSGYKSLNGLEWSRSGANKLLYHCYVTTATQYIKMFDLDNRGNGEVTLTTGIVSGIAGSTLSWSPDNAKIIYRPANGSAKPYFWTIATAKADSLSILAEVGNWKR